MRNTQMAEGLVREVELIMDGSSFHMGRNLIGAYTAAYAGYARTNDVEYLTAAEEAEMALRRFLSRMRLRRLLD